MVIALAVICAVYVFAYVRVVKEQESIKDRLDLVEQRVELLKEDVFEMSLKEPDDENFEKKFYEGLDNIMNYDRGTALKRGEEE